MLKPLSLKLKIHVFYENSRTVNLSRTSYHMIYSPMIICILLSPLFSEFDPWPCHGKKYLHRKRHPWSLPCLLNLKTPKPPYDCTVPELVFISVGNKFGFLNVLLPIKPAESRSWHKAPPHLWPSIFLPPDFAFLSGVKPWGQRSK